MGNKLFGIPNFQEITEQSVETSKDKISYGNEKENKTGNKFIFQLKTKKLK